MDANAIHLELLIHRRTRDLTTATRNEIWLSVGAAFLFLAIMSWRLPLPPLGVAGVVAWGMYTLYRFRAMLVPGRPEQGMAAPGLEHYRAVLQQRRAHLRNAWLWHGPLALAGLTFLAAVLPMAFPDAQRLRNMAPFGALLVVWIIWGLRLRHAQAAELGKELAEQGRD